MVSPADALPGRKEKMRVPTKHFMNGAPLVGPWPTGVETLVVGMGCFWGAERKFWQADGVFSTSVGYAGGYTENPTYEETCSGLTGHTEVVMVAFDTARTSLDA
ncbi:MAG: peptide-methionine (S)-S-oxide reductase, partial [Actinobacteria bacterium]|nr:peptide-methionine (S)-S-oxide reductase [Actinomycetota bacterium]